MKRWTSGIMLYAVLAGAATAAGCEHPVQGANGEKPNHRLHWTTRSEVLSNGFEVFRSDQSDGEFVKINQEPIPSATNSVRPREYEYKDFAIDPCKTYYYYVEAIAKSGYRTRLSAPQAAGPGAKAAAGSAGKPDAKVDDGKKSGKTQ